MIFCEIKVVTQFFARLMLGSQIVLRSCLIKLNKKKSEFVCISKQVEWNRISVWNYKLKLKKHSLIINPCKTYK